MSSSDSENRFLAMLIIAVPCLAFGGFNLMHTLRFALYAEAAQGVVLTESSRGDGTYIMFKGYPEMIRFSDSEGKVHTTTLYYGQPGFRIGKTVKILYKKYDPAGTARYGDASQLVGVSGAFLFIGALWVYGAFVVRKRGY